MRGIPLLLIVLAACAAPQYRMDDPDEEMRRALQDLAARRAELKGTASMQDCSRTCRLSGLVCEAAWRVCSIASRHPERADFGPRCTEANATCDEAKASCEGCKAGGARP